MEGLGAAPAMAPDAQGRGKTHSGSAPESGIMEFKKLQHFIRSLNGRPRYLLIRLSRQPLRVPYPQRRGKRKQIGSPSAFNTTVSGVSMFETHTNDLSQGLA